MSFQAYLDNVEKKTGKTPKQFVNGPKFTVGQTTGSHRDESDTLRLDGIKNRQGP